MPVTAAVIGDLRERPEPIPHAAQTERLADRRDRDEPVELARCGDCAWRRAPAIEEARGRRELVAEAAQSLARGSEEVRTQDRRKRPFLRQDQLVTALSGENAGRVMTLKKDGSALPSLADGQHHP